MSEAIQKSNENEKLSSALNEILSNPQMLSAISSMAQSLKSNNTPASHAEAEKEKEDSASTSTQNTAVVADKLPELLNMLSSNGSGVSHNRRSELLCALKPYLSQSRSDAIDKIIRFSELSSVFKNLS